MSHAVAFGSRDRVHGLLLEESRACTHPRRRLPKHHIACCTADICKHEARQIVTSWHTFDKASPGHRPCSFSLDFCQEGAAPDVCWDSPAPTCIDSLGTRTSIIPGTPNNVDLVTQREYE